MKFLFFFLLLTNSFAQVGIGTTTIEPSVLLKLESSNQAFVTTRVTTSEMNAISNPLEGSFVFNVTEQVPYVYINNVWTKFESNRTPALFLRRNSGTFTTSTTSEFQLPLNNSNIVENDPAVFSVNNTNGRVTILKDGIYLFASTLSTSNLNAGNKKFYLKLYKNNIAVGNLSATSFNFPSNDFWGGNGVIMINANANDVFDLRYFLNENGTTKTIAIVTYNITKLR
ncbi:hypothetical protein FLCU109888_09310 [Flavobacterium cucumis]|uniref:C1q domain-containing protein n=1 Tax=Flavobacterium cucumis TaxID=416016 RepID=A0A1M7ZX98_9FLAO|nr:hypothetical protein [Flavobacterium cucumis]SHO73478.1 hypothetical protein SAMN05443547_1839 [Flavobacterium cucumis]